MNSATPTSTELMSSAGENVMGKPIKSTVCGSSGESPCDASSCSMLHFHASLCLCSWTTLLDNTCRLRLAGQSLGISATFHRQGIWLLAPTAINQQNLRRTNHIYGMCSRTRRHLSLVINILGLILRPRTCVGALEATTQFQTLTLKASQESATHLSTACNKGETPCCTTTNSVLMRILSLNLKTATLCN